MMADNPVARLRDVLNAKIRISRKSGDASPQLIVIKILDGFLP